MIAEVKPSVQAPRRRRLLRRLLDLLFAVAAMVAANTLAQAVVLQPVILLPVLLTVGLALAAFPGEDDQ
jgi:fatty acid desaturase